MTPDEITDTIARIQHHLDSAADMLLELETAEAWKTLGITKAELAQRIFQDSPTRDAARQRLYRAIRAEQMRAELSDLMAVDNPGDIMSQVNPATIPDTTINALYQVEQAARVTVLKAAYRDNGGIVTVKAIQDAAEAVSEYGVFNVLPDGVGGHIPAHEAIGDLLYMQAKNERRMDSNRVYVVDEATGHMLMNADNTVTFFIETTLEKPVPPGVILRGKFWYEGGGDGA
jgi:hypothetical protein